MNGLFFPKRAFVFVLLLLNGLLVQGQSITNGSFDVISASCGTSSVIINRKNPFADGCVIGWQSSHGTPQLQTNGSSTGALDYVALLNGSVSGTTYGSSGIFTPYTFTSGTKYEILYWARGSPSNSSTGITIAIANGLQPDSYYGTNPAQPPASGITKQLVKYQHFNSSDFSDWKLYTATFVATMDATQLWLYSTPVSGDQTNAASLNNLTITTTCFTDDDYFQNTSTLPALEQTQGSIYAGNSATGAPPYGPVVVAAGQTVQFAASKEIQLKDGFSAVEGSSFSAQFVGVGCAYSRVASSPLAVAPSQLPVKLTASPNPATDYLHLPEGVKQVALYNSKGEQLIVQAVHSNSQLDVRELPNGLYLLRMVQDGIAATQKIVIKH
jgi:hypothetical protein